MCLPPKGCMTVHCPAEFRPRSHGSSHNLLVRSFVWTCKPPVNRSMLMAFSIALCIFIRLADYSKTISSTKKRWVLLLFNIHQKLPFLKQVDSQIRYTHLFSITAVGLYMLGKRDSVIMSFICFITTVRPMLLEQQIVSGTHSVSI